VSGATYAALRQGPHFKIAMVAIRWQCVRNLICSGYEPIPPALEADVLQLVPSGRYQAT